MKFIKKICKFMLLLATINAIHIFAAYENRDRQSLSVFETIKKHMDSGNLFEQKGDYFCRQNNVSLAHTAYKSAYKEFVTAENLLDARDAIFIGPVGAKLDSFEQKIKSFRRAHPEVLLTKAV